MIVETAVGKNFVRLHVSNSILICHGFPYKRGSVIEKSYSDLAQLMSEFMPTLIFDFSGCGNSGGSFSFYAWVEDLKRIAMKFKSVSIIGYSMGGLVALKASPELKNLEKIVLISTPLPDIFDGDRLKAMYEHAKNIMKIRDFQEFMTEMTKLKEEDILEKAGNIIAPKLVVHGTKDEMVPFKCGEEIYKALKEPKSFLKVINGDHFLRRNEKVIKYVLDWIRGKITGEMEIEA